MFGYIKPVKEELKVREWEAYQGIYCGLCKELGRSYGQLSRFTLSYDFAFLAMLSMGLKGEKVPFQQEACFAHPFRKKNCCMQNASLTYSCHVAVLLLYHKIQDNRRDGKWLERFGIFFLMPAVKSAYRKACQACPELSQLITEQMEQQAQLEKQNSKSIDYACEPTAKVMEAIFASLSEDEAQQRVLSRMGYLAGRWVYLIDALDDFQDDLKNKNYNPFAAAYDIAVWDEKDAEKKAVFQEAIPTLYMTIAEITKAYDLLEIQGFGSILENILLLGLKSSVDRAAAKIQGFELPFNPPMDKTDEIDRIEES